MNIVLHISVCGNLSSPGAPKVKCVVHTKKPEKPVLGWLQAASIAATHSESFWQGKQSDILRATGGALAYSPKIPLFQEQDGG